MEVFKKIDEIVHYLKIQKKRGQSIGFVPTMGALHSGHVKLLEHSVKENDLSIVSIFVNPTQFNNPEDLEKYPRTLAADLEKLESAGCNVVFCPDKGEVYNENRVLQIHFGYLEEILEGKYRPDHFKGVGLVVTKLFNIVNPDIAYFGQKDLQQTVVIKKLVQELNYNIKIRIIETVRSIKGLALSSRNEHLSEKEKDDALIFYGSLIKAKKLLLEGKNIKDIKNIIKGDFSHSENAKLEYFDIVDSNSLLSISNIKEEKNVSLCIAGYLGKIRLIDNISLI